MSHRIPVSLMLIAAGQAGAVECEDSFWEYMGDGSIYAVENGLLQPGAHVIYGYAQDEGVTILPACELAAPPGQTIKIPVLMIDFHDYVPGVDISNPNNPESGQFPGYVKQTSEQVAAYLNGPDGPAQYYDDVSDGRFRLQFEPSGWIVSSDTGYLRGRDFYMERRNGEWFCNKDALMLDAIRQSIVVGAVDWTQYDVEAGTHSNVLNNVDGAVLLYEGGRGLCSGTNMSWLSGSFLSKEDTQSGFYGYSAQDFRALVEANDPNKALFDAQPVLLNRYNNLAEADVIEDTSGAWVHELGHLFMGYSDYYPVKYNVEGWALSSEIGRYAMHPAAWEKWLFANWIAPVELPEYGTFDVAANQHADGGFDVQAPYLYRFSFDIDKNRYLTFEYHWFDADGNSARWSTNGWASSEPLKQSGIVITKFDWRLTVFDQEPQVERMVRAEDDPQSTASDGVSFQVGEVFDYCYSAERCLHIAVRDIDGETASLFFSDHAVGFDDYDRDGLPNSVDEKPYEPEDTDGDGMSNDVDEDDDNDGVPDAHDAWPLGRFTDAPPLYWAFRFIEALERAGITSGCGSDEYCPSAVVTRAQMAVFLERGMRGSDYSPPPASGQVFGDVGAGDFAAAFIEQLAADGVTSGCGDNNYCPLDNVNRAQMAVFLLRAKHGAGYVPAPAAGVFDDVAPGSFAADWIEALAAEGITSGCGGGNYCPGEPVTRAQMAVFLVRTFALQ